MQQEAMDVLFDRFEKVEALQKEGRLPEDDSKAGIHLFSRLAYVGHKLLHSYYQQLEDRKFRCVACMHDWTGATDDFGQACSLCSSKEDVYHLNHDHTTVWQCVKCKHEWRSEKGWQCPSCGALENPPRWTCKSCNHQWIGDEHICSKCHWNAWEEDE